MDLGIFLPIANNGWIISHADGDMVEQLRWLASDTSLGFTGTDVTVSPRLPAWTLIPFPR